MVDAEAKPGGAFACLVMYPMPDVSRPDDRQTLGLVATRHNGRVDSSFEFASMPGQVYVSFDFLDQARAFMDELTVEGRFCITRRPLADPAKLQTFLVSFDGDDEPRRISAEAYRRGARHVDFLVTEDDGTERILSRFPAHNVVGIARDD